MNIVSLLKNLLFVLVSLIIILWCYGTYAGQPLLLDIAMYLGDILVMGGAYLLPSITAALVKTPRLKKIIVINVLAGWLIIPWLIAMGLALKRDDFAADKS